MRPVTSAVSFGPCVVGLIETTQHYMELDTDERQPAPRWLS